MGAEAGAGVEEAGADVEGAEVGRAEDEGASNILPLVFRSPQKVTEGSSRFQQFFFTYAKLMAGLRLSKDSESEVTPLALHKAVMSVGKSSLEESCCAIIEI